MEGGREGKGWLRMEVGLEGARREDLRGLGEGLTGSFFLRAIVSWVALRSRMLPFGFSLWTCSNGTFLGPFLELDLFFFSSLLFLFGFGAIVLLYILSN